MSKRAAKRPVVTVADICRVLESIAPPALAQSWDNVGLLAGDLSAKVSRLMLCIDLTPGVVDEAIEQNIDLIMAYHPPIFKPISSLRVPSRGTDEAVFHCIRRGIAIYSMHTALDAAPGGSNDVLAGLCGIKSAEPFEPVEKPRGKEYKLVVFVPPAEVDKVAEAMFEAGAGRIGDYSHCSFRLPGQGTFWGGESTRPTIGQAGRLERVDEIRLEAVVPEKDLPGVISAMVRAHSYEEPAYDIYPLKPRPVHGIGRYGLLPKVTTLLRLARKLKKATGAARVQIVGRPDQQIERAVVAVGAAGSLPLSREPGPRDVIVTGEIRHHDALKMKCLGCSAIALGHWVSERPCLDMLLKKIKAEKPEIHLHLSKNDADPFRPV
jgi:dinuclear metal center YbgI/SA1388 family protein